ncbi:MAG TPA: JAB domain-containing protein [Allosphingosinicella sp.]|nr:JAB domain-containing protein [Allosphingosinicella sp.]
MIVGTAATAAMLLAPHFAGREDEAVAVLHLDRNHRLLATTFPAPAAESGDLPVRDILAAALRAGADSVIVARNHPAGDANPTEAEREAARRLADAGRLLEVRLDDHLVFAAGECRSFRELGLL